jgi:hypothetical protein
MSSEEKRTWISALVCVVVPVAYLAIVLAAPASSVVKIVVYRRGW